ADGRHPVRGIGRRPRRLDPSAELLLGDKGDAGAVRQTRGPRLRGGLAEGRQARLRLLVGVVEAGLPPGEVRLVEGVEDEQPLDRRLACRECERLAVVTRLVPGRSEPRGASAPPITWISGETTFSAS